MAELPVQTDPTPVGRDRHVLACPQTRTLVRRTTVAEKRRKKLLAFAAAAAAAATGVYLGFYAAERSLGTAAAAAVAAIGFVVIGVVTSRNDGWAVTPEGIVSGSKLTSWDEIVWFGVAGKVHHTTTKTSDGTSSRRPSHVGWGVGYATNPRTSPRFLTPANAPGADAAHDAIVITAAAWLIGAVPAHVAALALPPTSREGFGLEDLKTAFEVARSSDPLGAATAAAAGRDGVPMPAEAHGRGLALLDTLPWSGEDALARIPAQLRHRGHGFGGTLRLGR